MLAGDAAHRGHAQSTATVRACGGRALLQGDLTMAPRLAAALLLAALCLQVSQARAVAPQSTTATAVGCARLVAAANGQLVISTARWMGGGPLPPGVTRMMPMLAQVRLPTHCLIRGVLDPRIGVGGVKYGLGFELRMPAKWNGRFLFQGGGGLDGVLMPAVGLLPSGNAVALARGFAVISSDGGHEGPSAAFAADQQARLDFAYAGLAPVARLGQMLISRFYGRAAGESYFAGCSNGGREAMMVAERAPELFNGIIAGDPGFNLSRAAIAEMWSVKHLEAIAPEDAHGAPILSEALTQGDLQRVARAVLQTCDRLDGLRDGMINDIFACQKAFNPKMLLCKPGVNQRCLSKAKVATLEAVFGGPHDSAGRPLYASWPFDAGIDTPGWMMWKLGNSATATANALDATLGVDAMRYYFMTPPDGTITPATFDFNQALRRTAQTEAINDATGTFFSSYVARGGKLIVYEGMSDPVFSPNAIVGWYRELMSEDPGTRSWARLFLIPGMNHCGGGPATDQFDALNAIVRWTEHDRPPARLAAHGTAFPGVTRPLCPYPEYARYKGGNPSSAASFACVERP